MSNREFPERGIVWKVLERELWEARAADDGVDQEIMGGVTWPNPGGNVHLAAKEAANINFNAFLLGRYTQPSVVKDPPAIHHLMEPVEDDRFVDAYLASLAEIVDEVRSGERVAKGADQVYA
jgi:hypothetical protein